ncbi:MAG: hypothetical protein E7382_04080 [Clostridiales bacterium]|nr:hypothetical protein [Clostridiales bacterium]
MNNIFVDFNVKDGVINPLNGACCAPFQASYGSNQPRIKSMFESAHIPYCRLHDCAGIMNRACLVDIPKIFPDFDADENDPESYDFHHTDEYIGGIQKSGAEAYYRLGCSIEWSSKKYVSIMPKDFDKWARICEHVVMHYNKGWANGFNYNLKYWEIWNEPENPGNAFGSCQWSGTKEDLFRLYDVASKYLKEKFPEIKIGGYGGCGFYAVSRPDAPANRHDFVTYFIDFLSFVKERKCPFDFYSWHIYTAHPEEIIVHADYVRQKLDEYGFKNTESHLNEWNYQAEGTGFKSKHTMDAGSFLTKAMTLMHRNKTIDKAMYYCMSLQGLYNGFLDQNDYSLSPSWFAYVAFGHVYSLKNSVKTDYDGDIHAIASTNGTESAVLLTNHRCEDNEVSLSVKGIGKKTAEFYYCTDEKNLKKEMAISVCEDIKIEFTVPKNTVVLIKFI